MTEQDIDRLYGQMSDKDISNATILLFCIVVATLIVAGCIIGSVL